MPRRLEGVSRLRTFRLRVGLRVGLRMGLRVGLRLRLGLERCERTVSFSDFRFFSCPLGWRRFLCRSGSERLCRRRGTSAGGSGAHRSSSWTLDIRALPEGLYGEAVGGAALAVRLTPSRRSRSVNLQLGCKCSVPERLAALYYALV